MDSVIKTVPKTESKNVFAAVWRWVGPKLPAAVIVALIALYYIQLSHMG